MPVRYPTKYRDQFGEEITFIENDGKTLRMVLRGVEFSGQSFDDFEPSNPAAPSVPASFSFDHGMLCDCVMEWEMPLPVVVRGEDAAATLRAHLELSAPSPSPSLDKGSFHLELIVGNRVFPSTGKSGLFEDELLEIQRGLPEGVFLKACITCAFSDYHPAGNGMFGGMACFRDNKEGYLAGTGKGHIFQVWKTMTEFVQETHLCPEFQRRQPGTGYRG